MSLGRRAKIAAIIGALGAVQLGLVLAYRSTRDMGRVDRAFTAEAVAPTHAPLLIVDQRGPKAPLAYADRPTLVHFWATWCKPCREELPELLALAADAHGGVDVVAVSVDETWAVIDHFFDGRVPTSVVRASHDEVRAAFGVETLPASFLVDPAGVVRFRFAGAQAWSSPSAREWLASVRADRP